MPCTTQNAGPSAVLVINGTQHICLTGHLFNNRALKKGKVFDEEENEWEECCDGLSNEHRLGEEGITLLLGNNTFLGYGHL